ncbi:hypothetical protein DASC09_017930 [Saccharomycopsis crataegensis]|uniref:SHSP domain-containing protein n=1 Tax=Saccharomycopsis crataegensis TaxID=43959 RepID=A0AAV5QJZ4_9ASCO|nr:hypothetical protein DASC09_017930 [Saccharomycopsis crataegensis]
MSNGFFNDPFFHDPFFTNDPFFSQMGTRDRRRIDPNQNHFPGQNQMIGPTNNHGMMMSMMPSPMDLHQQMMSTMMDHSNGMISGFQNNSYFFGGNSPGTTRPSTGQIKTQVARDHYTLTLEIYNLDKSSLDLHVDPYSKQVMVSGSVRNEVNQNGFHSVSTESFQQSVGLPVTEPNELIDDQNVVVQYENNVLTIEIPKVSMKSLPGNDEPGNDEQYDVGRIEEIP